MSGVLESRGLDRGELAAFLLAAERFDAAHAALAVLLGDTFPCIEVSHPTQCLSNEAG
ncbi:MAG: hypothetical protein ACYCZV_16715 [Acidimicrobiales bacterium]